jgi:hypothetical protein
MSRMNSTDDILDPIRCKDSQDGKWQGQRNHGDILRGQPYSHVARFQGIPSRISAVMITRYFLVAGENWMWLTKPVIV